MSETQGIKKPIVIVAVDVGTSAVKLVAFTVNGQAVGRTRGEYPIEHPQPGYAQQDPHLLQTVVETALRDLLGEVRRAGYAVQTVCLSGTMHGLLAFDVAGSPLTPLLTWADGRADEQARALRAEVGERLYRATGVPMHAMTPFAKLLWLRTHQPAVWQRAVRFGSFKEWLLWQWTGRWLVDEATAAATGLYDVKTRDWADEWLRYAHVARNALSVCVPATTQVAVQNGPAARRCGLEAGDMMMVGSTDGVLANLGTVGLDEHSLAITAGTSAAVRQTVPALLLDDQQRTFCYPLTGEYWVAGGATNAGAMVLAKTADWLMTEDVRGLLALAEQAPPGSAGLLFAPWLAGERAPVYDARARGSYVGLSMEHDRSHLARAAVEGIALTLRTIAQALSTGALQQIVTSGGLAQSAFWRQLLADVIGLPVLQASEEEATCLGAFLLAQSAATSDWQNVVRATVSGSDVSARTTLPDLARHQLYTQRYETFTTLYRRLHDPV